MDIRELKTFVQVALNGNVTKAADVLNIAQPALSRQLQKLESEIGMKLLVRHGRGVRLTHAGMILLKQAESVTLLFDRIPGEVRRADEYFVESISVGVPPAAGLRIGPQIYREFSRRWPSATIKLFDGISSILEERLLDGRLDLALLYNASPLPNIETLPILRERMVLVELAGTPRAKSRSIPLRSLRDIPLILPSVPYTNRRLIEQAIAKSGVRLRLLLEIDSVFLIKAFVKAGIGATVLAEAAITDEIASGELSATSIVNPSIVSTTSIGWMRDTSKTSFRAKVADMLTSVVTGIVRDGGWPGASVITQRGTAWETASRTQRETP
jgi:LysR family nitrogen assimilation transcriptional regulator